MTEITRMLRFGLKWSVKLACGHSFECPCVTIDRQQLFLGKRISCTACVEEKKTRRVGGAKPQPINQ